MPASADDDDIEGAREALLRLDAGRLVELIEQEWNGEGLLQVLDAHRHVGSHRKSA